uniref:YCII-related domain-containing protein n=1 Tax=Mycena chlorophos TaxID=658473 RepID=A0ABQ0LXK6_MYCCL|nr:predicted protein [Mycena chlorophos]
MATPAPTLHKFFVYAPDKTDEGAGARRMAVRPRHLAGADKLIEQGVIRVGGATLTPESITGGERKMTGSVIIYEAASIEEVRKLVDNDPYFVGNVWDPEKLVIAPFAAATRLP